MPEVGEVISPLQSVRTDKKDQPSLSTDEMWRDSVINVIMFILSLHCWCLCGNRRSHYCLILEDFSSFKQETLHFLCVCVQMVGFVCVCEGVLITRCEQVLVDDCSNCAFCVEEWMKAPPWPRRNNWWAITFCSQRTKYLKQLQLQRDVKCDSFKLLHQSIFSY